MKIQSITAVSKVTGYGQMIVAAVLEYDEVISNKNLKENDFQVKHRKITGIYTNQSGQLEQKASEGRYVILELDINDESASVKQIIGKGRDSKLKVAPVEVEVLLPNENQYRKSNKTVNQTIDAFQSFTFLDQKSGKTLDYNFYIPQKIERGRRYPLVLFTHDAGSCSEDVIAPLAQGNGATVWAEAFEQQRHPCFVLAPLYREKGANDDFEVTWVADATVSLVLSLVDKYPVDEKRIYGTGQSMGCMILCELLLLNPAFFAGCFLVAGQWDPGRMGAVKDENLWILVSEKDDKAFPIMGNCMKQVERRGGKVVRGGINARESLDIQNECVRKLARSGEHIFFTWFCLKIQRWCLQECIIHAHGFMLTTWKRYMTGFLHRAETGLISRASTTSF